MGIQTCKQISFLHYNQSSSYFAQNRESKHFLSVPRGSCQTNTLVNKKEEKFQKIPQK